MRHPEGGGVVVHRDICTSADSPLILDKFLRRKIPRQDCTSEFQIQVWAAASTPIKMHAHQHQPPTMHCDMDESVRRWREVEDSEGATDRNAGLAGLPEGVATLFPAHFPPLSLPQLDCRDPRRRIQSWPRQRSW